MSSTYLLFIAPIFAITFGSKISEVPKISEVFETSEIWYVNATATSGNNDGTSWQDAFTDLQDALAAAAEGDSVWVAKGTYLPTNTLDRGISFNIPKGVALLGGFAGNEALAAQRNPSANETTLSGDIGQKNDFADNSYHVLYALGSDSETLVDGFTIANGNASADGGGGLYVAADADHPISSPIISNCTFLNNRGMQGGAINAISSDAALAFPVLQNCSFRGNQATTGGGAVYIKGGASYMPQRYVSGCSFVGNKTSGGWGFGGAVYINDIDNTISFDSCHFEKDTANLSGGAVCHEAIHKYSNVFFNSCTFRENLAQSGGGFLHFFSGYPTDSTKHCHFVFNNCLFYKNKVKNTRGGGIEISDFNATSKTEVYNSVFKENEGNSGGAGIYVYNHCFKNGLGFCDSELIVEGCRFEGNQSSTPAANGIYYQGQGTEGARNKSRIVNNTFFNNGGAIAMISGNKGGVDALVANCTFHKNGNWPIIKNWQADFDSSFYNNMTITNCILWENTPIYRLFYNNSPDYTIYDYNIHHSIVSVPDCIVNGVDGCNEGMLYQAYPMFIDSLNGDLRVAACSPAINAGENQTVLEQSIANDLDGTQRILNDTVDMGAFEQYRLSVGAAAIQGASSPSTADGAISIDSINGGSPPYHFLWEDSSTANYLDNIQAGTYNVTITDSDSCSFVQVFEVMLPNSTGEPSRFDGISLYPNPAGDLLWVEPKAILGQAVFKIYTPASQFVLSEPLANKRIEISLIDLMPGLYFWEVSEKGRVLEAGKIVKIK